MSAMSTYLENALVNHVLRNTPYTSPGLVVYVGLIKYYDSAKVEDNSLVQEISGNGYARQLVTAWDGVIDGATQNTSNITFPTATGDWNGVSGVIITDHATAGKILLHGSLTTARDVKSGDVFKFNGGDLDVTFA